MPLFEISAAEAIEIRKQNAFASWGNRASANRVEPIAKPSFDAPFKIEPGEKIFTVGSCFARNVETELMRRGFKLPMRELFSQPAFASLDAGVVNNFGTPSIYNEFAWALGAREFDPDKHLFEVQNGKFVDLHVISSIRPDKRETVEARRRAIIAAYRSVLECRVLIMTLGLVEVWYDSHADYYLNSAPLPGMLRANPDRFRLHVLSFEEAYKYLEDALLLIKQKARDDFKVVLTVSPVPLMLTHRPQDVMVANAYSKSVLRAVAESIVMKHDFVTYYPSYESVTLSSRTYAWKDDLIHVTDDIVALNVQRMVSAYIRSDDSLESLKAEIDMGGLGVAIDKAREMREKPSDIADAFFAAYPNFAQESVEFALQQAEYLASARRYDEAVAVLRVFDGTPDQTATTQLMADCLLKSGAAREAYERLDAVLAAGNRSGILYTQLLRAAQAMGDEALVLAAAERWGRVAPKRAGRANALVARWFYQRGELERALQLAELAMRLDTSDVLAKIYQVDILQALGRMDEAVALHQLISPGNQNELILHRRQAEALGL